MNNGAHIRAQRIDRDVHRNLAGTLARTFDLTSVHVTNDEILRLHKALAYSRRRTEYTVLIEPDTDIAIVHRHPSFVIDETANTKEILAMLLLGLAHANPILSGGFSLARLQ